MTATVNWILHFMLYSVLGWVAEVTFCSIGQRKMVRRGFLFGPYCPIYGFGALLIIFATDWCQDNVGLVFLTSLVVCSALEYVTSYVMEKLFKIRWWDYSESDRINLNGRICLRNSLVFGLGGVAITLWARPLVDGLVMLVPEAVRATVAVALVVVMLLDLVASTFATKAAAKMEDFGKIMGDQTHEVKELARKAVRQFFKPC